MSAHVRRLRPDQKTNNRGVGVPGMAAKRKAIDRQSCCSSPGRMHNTLRGPLRRGTLRSPMPTTAPLAALLPKTGETLNVDEILNRFVGYVSANGLSLYPAQEEAFLELL